MLWSIIVCTHNRAEDLKVNLPRLAAVDPSEGQCEVIVVDNNSTDDTVEVVRLSADYLPNLSYIKEDKLGLSHARNRGIAAARGEFIAFIDDDAWPERNWLHELEKMFQIPDVACVGGMVKPAWQNRDRWPNWLPERLVGCFTVVDHRKRRMLHYPDYPAGTNIAFRKSVFEKIGTFTAELGRTGESLLSMEEVDLCLKIEQAGFNIAYTPEAVVHHKVHENRLTKEWVKQRSYWQGISAAVVERARFNRSKIVVKTLKYLFFIPAGLLGEMVFKYAKNEKMSFYCMCQVILCKAYIMKVWKSI